MQISIGPINVGAFQKGTEERVAKAKHDATKLALTLAANAVRSNFDRAEDETGRAWAPVKDRPGGKPLQDKLGRMKKGITFEQTGDSSGFVAAGEATAAYNAIHNFGGTTGPHDIYPRRARALAFMMGGKKIVRRMVHHPGSKIPRRQFMYLSDRAREMMVRAVQALFLKRMGG